jgi:phosphoglycolate phosphatase
MQYFRSMVLFDIDGTLIRKAGPHHRQALVQAVRAVTGLESTTEGIPVQGMLDRDILRLMMRDAGANERAVARAMPSLVEAAQEIYALTCPDLRRKVCPGARMLLYRLSRKPNVVTGLVTGNLTRIGWKKMERAGLKPYLRFGAFAELGKDRASLVALALKRARKDGWIDSRSTVSLVGDHPNDVRAAKANGVRSVAVTTGLSSAAELREYSPDVLVDDLRQLPFEWFLTGLKRNGVQ